MPNYPSEYKIHDEPLAGYDAIAVGSRIIIWNHITNKIAFAGNIIRIIGNMAFGENFVHNPETDGKIAKTTALPFDVIGLVPRSGSKDTLNDKFRTYAMPETTSPFDYQYYRVLYKIPEQVEVPKSRPKKPKKGTAAAKV